MSGLAPGTYTATVTDSVGAYFMEEFTVEGSVSIEPDLLEKLITVYPNPTRDQVFVDLNGLDYQEASLTLTDLRGQQVMPAISLQHNQSEARFNVSHLPKGLYSLQIKVDDSRMSKKVTVL